MTNNFPTTWEPGPKFHFKDPPKKKSGRIWLCIFAGVMIGFFLSVVTGANIWFPAGFIATFILWAVGEEDKQSD